MRHSSLVELVRDAPGNEIDNVGLADRAAVAVVVVAVVVVLVVVGRPVVTPYPAPTSLCYPADVSVW